MTEALFAELFHILDTLILAEQEDGAFLALGQVPNWFRGFHKQNSGTALSVRIPETFPFLNNFLIEARQYWHHQISSPFHSDLWIETTPQGAELPLEASALFHDNLHLLLIRHIPEAYQVRAHLLQTGRETVLASIENNKQTAKQLQRATFYDSLTGLPNQALFQLQLAQALRQRELFTLCLLDIDRFKDVNMRFGQQVGDLLLMEVASRIRHQLAADVFLARLEGDNFAFILKSIGGPEETTIALIEQLLQKLAPPYQVNGHEISLKYTFGLTHRSKLSLQPDITINHAKIAMNYAGYLGMKPYAVFKPEMQLQLVRYWDLEHDLPRSIQREELLVLYHPITSLMDNALSGFEALIRWQHPTYGLLSPVEFIPMSEKNDFILILGEWVLSQACTQLVQWQEHHNPQLKIHVNLSVKQFLSPGIAQNVQSIIEQSSIQPTDLIIEITEGMVLDNLGIAIEQLNQIKNLGVSICIDDFGAGVSSLNTLNQLPIDSLKIDRSLTQLISAGSTKILKAIVSMSHNLGLSVTAEGIETDQQLDWVRSLGCDYAQGFLFSRPVPADTAFQFCETDVNQ